MASTLLLIKSRSLLPTLELSEDERESVAELERRLALYSKIRAAAKVLRKEWNETPLIFTRRTPPQPPIFAHGEATTTTINTAIRRLISLFPRPEKMTQAAVAPVLKLEEVIESLRGRISRSIRTHWSELTKGADKHLAIVHFLAVLELVRSGSASVTQEKLFSDITIEADDMGEALHDTESSASGRHELILRLIEAYLTPTSFTYPLGSNELGLIELFLARRPEYRLYCITMSDPAAISALARRASGLLFLEGGALPLKRLAQQLECSSEALSAALGELEGSHDSDWSRVDPD